MPELRKTEILINDEWKPVDFRKLGAGDVFRMWNDDDLHTDAEGNTQWMAIGEAYQDLITGIWTVDVDIPNAME